MRSWQDAEGVLDLPAAGVNSFLGLREISRGSARKIQLPNNQLWSFESFGTQDKLRTLDVRNNHIASFLGMTKQRRLEDLQIRGNPVAQHPHCRIMALLTVGFSLKRVDDEPVTQQDLERARQLGPTAALAVSCGWLLDFTPRDEREYDEIIRDLRTQRRAMIAKHSGSSVRTIMDAVSSTEAASAPTPAEGPPPPEPTHTDAMPDESRSLQRKAMVHLSKRVAYLEAKLSSVNRELQAAQSSTVSRHQLADMSGAAPSSVVLQAAEVTGFTLTTTGVVEASNVRVAGQTCTQTRVAATMTAESVVIATLLHRSTLWCRAWDAVVNVIFDGGLIRIVCDDGSWVALRVAAARATAVWKAVHLMWGRVPPTISWPEPSSAVLQPAEPRTTVQNYVDASVQTVATHGDDTAGAEDGPVPQPDERIAQPSKHGVPQGSGATATLDSSLSSSSSSSNQPTPSAAAVQTAAPTESVPEAADAIASVPDEPPHSTTPAIHGSDSDSDSSEMATTTTTASAATKPSTAAPQQLSSPSPPASTASDPVASVAAMKPPNVVGSPASASGTSSAPPLGGPQSALPAGRRAFRPSYALSDSSSDD